jgi:hypothetical protein
MIEQAARGLDSQYRRTRSPSHEEGDAMYEEIRSQSTALTLPVDHEDEVEALVDLVQDLSDQNSHLSELVALLQRQLVLARLRAIVETPCFP